MSIKIDSRTDGDAENASYSEPDLELIGDLLERIERTPLVSDAHLLLMQHYAMCGWHSQAKEEANRVLAIDPLAKEAQVYLAKTSKVGQCSGKTSVRRKGPINPTTTDKGVEGKGGHTFIPYRQRGKVLQWQPHSIPITSPAASLQELGQGYVTLLENAKLLLDETKRLKDMNGPECADQILDLTLLAKGQVSSVVRPTHLESIRIIVNSIVAENKKGFQAGLNAAVEDLERLSIFLTKQGNAAKIPAKDKSETPNDLEQDEIRNALMKRVKVMKALLPKDLQSLADLAMMHAEHEILHRNYVNDETMISGDPVSEIPRSSFWSSEDGYAWDMEELAEAIKSGKGVMRNPLSKIMFSRTDIRAIIQHPLGKDLQALQLKQNQLKRGVRRQTIDELDSLAKVLLADMSEDGKPSHLAVENFVAYLETLPSDEQKSIAVLQVPAKDSHTGMAFDSTVGEAVDDMQGNRVCSHKIGDFLAQAVKFLM